MNEYVEGLFSLRGRVALVTGASGGIGSEIAFALSMAGASVALLGRSIERLELTRTRIETNGGTATVHVADIDRPETLPSIIRRVNDTSGTVDILVNCAGINRREPITNVLPETFDQLIAINLKAPYFLSQAVAQGMISGGGGKILNIGSLASSWGIGNLSVYGLTKSAISQMTRVMAVEWARHNIQVNCICPGWIETDLTAPLWADEHKKNWILERVPARRPGVPSDVAGMAVYLASQAANFTTGQTVFVDGGFMAGGQW